MLLCLCVRVVDVIVSVCVSDLWMLLCLCVRVVDVIVCVCVCQSCGCYCVCVCQRLVDVIVSVCVSETCGCYCVCVCQSCGCYCVCVCQRLVDVFVSQGVVGVLLCARNRYGYKGRINEAYSEVLDVYCVCRERAACRTGAVPAC